ncbi:MAG TPA: phage holin family protein [Mycobacteriales bacterium]|jgi:hypothetical protein|nr:phage holin family protein [Mycobacteriales bacterium]
MADPYPSERGAVSMSQETTHDATVTRDVSQASVGELISEVTSDLSTLMRKELELAKAEMKVEAQKAGKGVGMLGGAGYAGHMVALFLSLALSWALSDLFDFSWGWGFAIVAVLWAIVAAVLYSKGREQMKKVNPKPEQTVETLKEDVQWAKNRTR